MNPPTRGATNLVMVEVKKPAARGGMNPPAGREYIPTCGLSPKNSFPSSRGLGIVHPTENVEQVP